MDAPKLFLDRLPSVQQPGDSPQPREGLALALLGMKNAVDLLRSSGSEIVAGRRPGRSLSTTSWKDEPRRGTP